MTVCSSELLLQSGATFCDFITSQKDEALGKWDLLLRKELGGASSSLKELILIDWGCKHENTIRFNHIALRMAKTP